MRHWGDRVHGGLHFLRGGTIHTAAHTHDHDLQSRGPAETGVLSFIGQPFSAAAIPLAKRTRYTKTTGQDRTGHAVE